MNITQRTRKLVTAAFLAAAALSWHGSSVAAVVQEVRVLFDPATITLPDTTELVIEVKTSQGNIQAGMDIEVPLPTGLESVGAMTFSTECSANTANISTNSSVLRVTGLSSSPGRTCRMSVELGARTAGRYEFAAGSIIVRSEGQSTGNAQNAILDVLASPPAVFVATPASLDFGNLQIGTTSAPQTVTLRNDGGSPLALSGISTAGDFNFAGCGTPLTLNPGASCTLQVTFAPLANGLRTGSLQIMSDAAGSPLVIELSGTGTEAERTVPQISLSSTALDFGTIKSGSTALLRVRLESIGTAPVTISAVGINGDGFSRSHDCSDSLPPGDGCDIWVAFAPASAGSYGGTLTVNASAGSFELPLSGTAVDPQPAIDVPGSIDFGTQTINVASVPQTVTVRNAGTAPLLITAIVASGDFNFTGCATPLTLDPDAGCTLSVKFLPTASGARVGAITISSNAPGDPYAIALTGAGTFAPVPAISATPSSANFGAIIVGTSATARVAISNTGEADLAISDISIDGPHFLQSNTCPGVLAPATTCSVVVTYSPAVVGAHSAALRITSNAVPSPLTISLAGSALPVPVPAMQLSSNRLAFGPTFVNTVSSPGMVTLTNAGTGPMQISSIVTTGDFGYSGCGFPRTIPAGGSCILSITFQPMTGGPLEGSIQVLSDAPGSPHTINLSGEGAFVLNPAISLTPAALDFGTLRVGSDGMSVMRLTNVGNMALSISAISSAGAMFSQANNCPASLAAAAFCDIEVTYAPTSPGAHSGQLRIVSNATPSEHIAALSGIGIPVPPPFMVVDRLVDFGQQLTGSVTGAALAISNTGGKPLAISRMQLFGAPEFGLEGSCAVVQPGETCSVTVFFAPTLAGVLGGRIEIVSNHSAGMVSVDLVGQGIARPRADIELSIGGLGFGNQVVGSVSDPRPVGVTNVGNAPLQILGFDLPLDFQVDSRQCPAQLAPEASCELLVTFKPVIPGPRGGELTINSNAIGAPASISLTGTGCRFFTMGAARNPQRLCAP